jgi:hypothetical protein
MVCLTYERVVPVAHNSSTSANDAGSICEPRGRHVPSAIERERERERKLG